MEVVKGAHLTVSVSSFHINCIRIEYFHQTLESGIDIMCTGDTICIKTLKQPKNNPLLQHFTSPTFLDQARFFERKKIYIYIYMAWLPYINDMLEHLIMYD